MVVCIVDRCETTAKTKKFNYYYYYYETDSPSTVIHCNHGAPTSVFTPYDLPFTYKAHCQTKMDKTSYQQPVCDCTDYVEKG